MIYIINAIQQTDYKDDYGNISFNIKVNDQEGNIDEGLWSRSADNAKKYPKKIDDVIAGYFTDEVGKSGAEYRKFHQQLDEEKAYLASHNTNNNSTSHQETTQNAPVASQTNETQKDDIMPVETKDGQIARSVLVKVFGNDKSVEELCVDIAENTEYYNMLVEYIRGNTTPDISKKK